MVQARTSAKEFFNADERLADLGLIATYCQMFHLI